MRPVPGNRHVHNFFLSDRVITQHDTKRKLPGDDLIFGKGNRYGGVRISVPHESERYPSCRTTSALKGLKNESAYSTDSGLWTACRASRSAMERYFTKNERWSDFSESDQSQTIGSSQGRFQDQPGRSNTIAYYSSGENQPCHEPQWITIRPDEDLMILKHPGLSYVDWFHLYAWSFSPRIHPLFFGRHVALDYDPLWLDILQGLMLRRCPVRITANTTSIIDAIRIFYDEEDEGDADTAKTLLWFIDHRLRRVCNGQEPTQEEEEREHFTFRSVNYLFTEVKIEEMGTRWRIEDHVENEGSVFEFFETLDRHPALAGLASCDLVRVLAREPVLGSDATVDITKTGYRNQLGDACFDSPETRIRPAQRIARIVERAHVEDDDEDIDIANFNLFGDD